MEAIFAGILVVGLFVGPLVARVIFDRSLERADAVAADVRAAMRRRLGGESLVSARVQPAAPWRPARVLLSAPSGYEYLIQQVWPAVVEQLPPDHDLVVRPAAARAEPKLPNARPLHRAA